MSRTESISLASMATVKDITLKATDNAGDGTIEGDVSATDFTTQTGKTYVEVLSNMIVSIIHKGVLYAYTGPKNVRLGVGVLTQNEIAGPNSFTRITNIGSISEPSNISKA